MVKKKADGWSEAYPYDFYVYKDENNKCPECKRTPITYRVPTNYYNRTDVEFTCASSHTWIHQREAHMCEFCNQEGIYEDDEYYKDLTIWWCYECLDEYRQDQLEAQRKQYYERGY